MRLPGVITVYHNRSFWPHGDCTAKVPPNANQLDHFSQRAASAVSSVPCPLQVCCSAAPTCTSWPASCGGAPCTVPQRGGRLRVEQSDNFLQATREYSQCRFVSRFVRSFCCGFGAGDQQDEAMSWVKGSLYQTHSHALEACTLKTKATCVLFWSVCCSIDGSDAKLAGKERSVQVLREARCRASEAAGQPQPGRPRRTGHRRFMFGALSVVT